MKVDTYVLCPTPPESSRNVGRSRLVLTFLLEVYVSFIAFFLLHLLNIVDDSAHIYMTKSLQSKNSRYILFCNTCFTTDVYLL